MKNQAILALEDGTLFFGNSIGAHGIRCGELIFNTAMSGYQEILTDPSYAQQIITFTYPHIGNVGVNTEDEESKNIWAAGIVVKELSQIRSNWRAEGDLSNYLNTHGVVGISGIDTRKLTHILREKGSLKSCIMVGENNPQKAIECAQSFEGLAGKDLTSLVTTDFPYELQNDAKTNFPPLRVVVYDFGVKQSILNFLMKENSNLIVVPSYTPFNEVLELDPDGILLSNGPGDPMACHSIIQTIQNLIKTNIPIFGICLGHQLLSLALGGKTVKMKFGHHGANHPVQDLFSKTIMITSQNHSFMVDENSLPTVFEPTHKSLFDGSLQGFRHKNKPIFGFQGHPEAGPGPEDAFTLFKPFIDAMNIKNQMNTTQKVYAETY